MHDTNIKQLLLHLGLSGSSAPTATTTSTDNAEAGCTVKAGTVHHPKRNVTGHIKQVSFGTALPTVQPHI